MLVFFFLGPSKMLQEFLVAGSTNSWVPNNGNMNLQRKICTSVLRRWGTEVV